VIRGIAWLVLLCACRMYWTWASRGNVSTDCGREEYVPAVLAKDRCFTGMLVSPRSVAPYLNSLLYTAFFAGALSRWLDLFFSMVDATPARSLSRHQDHILAGEVPSASRREIRPFPTKPGKVGLPYGFAAL
jgi:hypothetical protein